MNAYVIISLIIPLLFKEKLTNKKRDKTKIAQDNHLGTFDEVFKNVSPKFLMDRHSKIIAKRLKGYSKKYIILFKTFP